MKTYREFEDNIRTKHNITVQSPENAMWWCRKKDSYLTIIDNNFFWIDQLDSTPVPCIEYTSLSQVQQSDTLYILPNVHIPWDSIGSPNYPFDDNENYLVEVVTKYGSSQGDVFRFKWSSDEQKIVSYKIIDLNMMTKLITFENKRYRVPIWVNFVARDSDGDIRGFKDMPYTEDGYWNSKSESFLIMEGSEWFKTLIVV